MTSQQFSPTSTLFSSNGLNNNQDNLNELEYHMMKSTIPYTSLLCLICLVILGPGCATVPKGLVEGGPVMNSPHIPEPVPYRIYTPPGWDNQKPLPLVIYLHQEDGHCTDLETGGVVQYLFGLISSKQIRPFILAAPESRGYWYDYHDGTRKYASFIMDDFIPQLRQEHAIIPGAMGVHILGAGLGGQAAVELSIHYPDKFRTAGAIGSYMFDEVSVSRYVETQLFKGLDKILGPSDDFNAMAAHNVMTGIQSREDIGKVRYVLGMGAFAEWDIAETNELFRQHLQRLYIPHDWVHFHGSTKWASRRNIVPIFISLQLGFRKNQGNVNGMPYQVLKFR